MYDPQNSEVSPQRSIENLNFTADDDDDANFLKKHNDGYEHSPKKMNSCSQTSPLSSSSSMMSFSSSSLASFVDERWVFLLSNQRRESGNRTATSLTTDQYRRPFQRDYDKVIFSSAFSRLKDKTQVFPLASHDSVHNRMNHSLEVHAVGKTLVRALFDSEYKVHNQIFHSGSNEKTTMMMMNEQTWYHRSMIMRDMEDIVATAALLHDIGNPPFGHSGEEAMRKWWHYWCPPGEWAVSEYWDRLKTNVIFDDFKNFEGNATGFRVIQQKIPKLTFATMTTYMKYPCMASGRPKKGGRYKKNGIYMADLFKYKQMTDECRLTMNYTDMTADEDTEKNDPTREFSWMRHPLTYLVEAADDICYLVVDVEDGARMKVISYESAREQLLKLCPSNRSRTDNKITHLTIEEQVKSLRVEAIEHLVKGAIRKYCEHFEQYCSGEFREPLVSGPVLKEIKEFSIENVYGHRSVIEIESAGFTVIKYLMNRFVNACMMYRVDRESNTIFRLLPSDVRQRIEELYELHGCETIIDECEPPPVLVEPSDFDVFDDFFSYYAGKRPINPQVQNLEDPVAFCLRQQHLPKNQEHSLHMIYHIVIHIADYISGMTDSFATSLYKKLNGISL